MKDKELHTARTQIKGALIALRLAVADAEKALESDPVVASCLMANVSVLADSAIRDAEQAEAYFDRSRAYIEENRLTEEGGNQ